MSIMGIALDIDRATSWILMGTTIMIARAITSTGTTGGLGPRGPCMWQSAGKGARDQSPLPK